MQLVNQSVFLRILGWALFSSLWQMGLLWIAYSMLTGRGKRFSATVRHNIAFILLGTGCIGFLASLLTTDITFASSFLTGNNLFFSANSAYVFLKRISDFILPYISVAYLGALIVLFIRYLNLYVHAYRLKYTGLHKIQPELRIFTSEAASQLGIKKKVNVWLSSVADSPMTVGFLKSVILIPVATINNLSTQQAEAILLHELAHIKRNDYFINLLLTVTGILFFFNPFAKLLIRNIRKETENSCDDLVMQFCYDPHSYASALLSLEKMRNHQQLAMAAAGRHNHLLLERVKRITGQSHKFKLGTARVILLLLTVLASIIATKYSPFKSMPQNVKLQSAYEKHFIKIPSDKLISFAFQPLQLPDDIKIKTEKPSPAKNKKAEIKIVPDNNPDASYYKEVKLVTTDENNNDEEATEADNVALTTVQAEPVNRDYSIGGTIEEAPAAPTAVTTGSSANFPFVPKSSFNFKVMEDTSYPNSYKVTYDEKMAQESMTKALAALDQIDWKKLKREISKNNSNINMEKLQEALRNSIAGLDWQKINEENPVTITQDELKKMSRDIKIQLQALQTNQLRNSAQTQNMLRRLKNEELKLERENLQKQQQLLKKLDTAKHKKIVYI